MTRATASALLFAVAVLASTTSAAAGIRLLADERGTAACSLDDLHAELSTILGDAAVATDAALTARVSTRHDHDAIVATVTVVDAAGTIIAERTVTAHDCADASASLAVVIALLARSMPESDAPPATLVDLPPPTRPLASPLDEPVRMTRHARATRREPLHVEALASAGLAVASLDPTLVLGARARTRASATRTLGAELSLRLPEDIPMTEAGGRVVVTTVTATVAPCLHRVLGSVDACALVTGGIVRGRGDDLADARAPVTPVLAAGARVAWQRPLTERLALRIHLDARAALTRTTFLVDEAPAWTTASHEESFGIGVVAQIP